MTLVERDTRCFLGIEVGYERESARLHALLNRTPSVQQYYSDQFEGYSTLVDYPGQHTALPNKSQTYAVAANNAEQR